MLFKIAAFEFRYQMKQPAFWVVTILFGLLGFGLVAASDNIQIGGAGGNVFVNSAFSIMLTNQVLNLFFLLGTVALVANAVARDSTSGFGPLINATPINRFDYVVGRFLGAFAVAALAFTSVNIGLILGTFMPWIDPETLQPLRLGDYVFAYLVYGLTGVFFSSAVVFALATLTRSMMASYVGAVGMIILYFVVTSTLLSKPELRELGSWLEPLGIGAHTEVTRYWTAAEKNTRLPELTGVLLGNRLLWTGVGVAFIAAAVAFFSRSPRGSSEKKLAKMQKVSAKAARKAPEPKPLVAGKYGAAQTFAQLIARTRFEMGLIFKSPAYIVLMLFGFLMSISNLVFGGEMYGVKTFLTTRAVIEQLEGSFSLVALIIAIYYSGELVWRDQDRKIHEIVDSTPAPDWTFMVPKALGLTLVLVSTLIASVLAGIFSQAVSGWFNFELGKYLLWYVLPSSVSMIMIAILAIFVQALSPNRFVGWAIMVLYIISTLVMASLGFDHYLYSFGDGPSVPTSDLNGMGGLGLISLPTTLYWSAFCVILLVVTYALWRRGAETRYAPRLARAPRRFKGKAGLIGGLAAVAFAGLGVLVFINTNVWNTYERKQTVEARMADREKQLLAFENQLQPQVVDVKMNIDLRPSERRMLTTGSYVIENQTEQPLETVHLNWPRETKMKIEVEGAKLDKEWKEHQYQIYRFDTPLQPGEKRTIKYESEYGQKGFGVGHLMTDIVSNGSFINDKVFSPSIGMDRSGLLTDRVKRRKHGLPAELRMRDLNDAFGLKKNYIGASWVNSDITLTTDADQTPIAPGYKVSDETKNGRRTARFVSEAPILHFFSVQSARYELAKEDHNGIALEVYHHPTHGTHAPRMIKALKTGLDYFQSAFGPYQFRQARIIEFPGYSSFAQAFANTMPYSESIGFNADLRKPDAIDYVTFVTAHELAHQWWAHQIVGANVQGATTLSETLAEYSALMVMEKMYGADQIRRFLKYDLDSYLGARGGERLGEFALERVEAGQGYIHYRKGGHVLYLLRDQLGEDVVNRALAKLLAAHKFGRAPYPRSVDLIAAIRAEAPADKQGLITDLMEKITLYDLKVTSTRATERADGRWDVVLQVEARKLYADAKGTETTAPLEETMEIGLFNAEPGHGAFDSKDIVLVERRVIRSGPQTIRLIANSKPKFAGVDPYIRWIDRVTTDNIKAID
ncbi:M1 family aminopeptidase [uncultured Brevundimonas sp.]|uniref:ABC transporter permease/M1 family aminopeptidase n=1 Tax=uncultured Brevundimonas sp. TaxID=213418 RepID=UPI002634858C|nr:M1 family aminopeptidase [uncultured Brevundimonas sp.]